MSSDTLRVISSSTLFSAMYAMLMYGEEYAFMTWMKAVYLGTVREVRRAQSGYEGPGGYNNCALKTGALVPPGLQTVCQEVQFLDKLSRLPQVCLLLVPPRPHQSLSAPPSPSLSEYGMATTVAPAAYLAPSSVVPTVRPANTDSSDSELRQGQGRRRVER